MGPLLNGLPTIAFTNSYLRISHNINVRTMFAVMRSGQSRTTWNNHGAFLNRITGRSCNWLVQHAATYLHYNQYPSRMWRNGVQLSGNFNLSPINQWMIVTVEVCDGGNMNYYIARSDHSQSDMEIGEILGFDSTLSDTERGNVEAYLAQKWGLTLSG